MTDSTNAERQARHRAKRDAELRQLRKLAARLKPAKRSKKARRKP
jgi:hypothetical protein